MQNRSISSLPAVFDAVTPVNSDIYMKGTNASSLWVYDVTYLHFHKYIELGYCVNGEGICYVDDKEYTFSAGDVQIIFPYQHHLSKNTSPIPSTWFWAAIDIIDILESFGYAEIDRINGWIRNEMAICGIVKEKENPKVYESIKKILSNMYEPKTKPVHPEALLAVDILNMLLILADASSGHPKLSISSGRKIMEIAPGLERMKNDFDNEIKPTVERMSEACNMSVSNFRRVFKNAVGVPPKDHITACMIHKAKKLLACTDINIADVGTAVGYQNISGFNRSFVEITGMTPSEFRNSMRAPENTTN